MGVEDFISSTPSFLFHTWTRLNELLDILEDTDNAVLCVCVFGSLLCCMRFKKKKNTAEWCAEMHAAVSTLTPSRHRWADGNCSSKSSNNPRCLKVTHLLWGNGLSCLNGSHCVVVLRGAGFPMPNYFNLVATVLYAHFSSQFHF